MFIKHHYHHNPLKNIYLKNNMKKRKVIVKKNSEVGFFLGCEKYITRSISKKRLKNKSRKAENLSPSVVLFSFHFLYF